MESHDPYAAWRLRNYRLFAIGRLVSGIGLQMEGFAVGWQVYERTGSAFALGLVGLIQVIPVMLFTLPAGHVADTFDRRKVVLLTYLIFAIASFGLAWVSYTEGSITLIYTFLFLVGIARAFAFPASASLLPQLVPEELFSNAVTWNSTGFQISAVAGPAMGGILVAMQKSATPVYLLGGLGVLANVVLLSCVSLKKTIRKVEPMTWNNLVAGMKFVWNTKVIMAALTLDLFAVLLGGATALLPMYAKDILHVGPSGLGWLRSAPFLGSAVMSFLIAHAPPFQRAGRALLWSVGGFGVATIIFGVSQWFWLSMVALFLTGFFDGVSVVIRQVLVQVFTPDAMRGRVSAVNSLFIGSSNELGEFESGVMAAWLGPVIAVVSGGVGTIFVVMAVAMIWPEIVKLKSLNSHSRPT